MKLPAALFALAILSHVSLAQTTWYVDVAGTPPGTGTAGNPYTSIQYAIERPSTAAGDTLSVRAGTYFENIDYLGKNIVIRSQHGSDVTTIDGGMAAPVVTFQRGETLAARLQGFTITNGAGADVDGYGVAGAGLLCIGASPALEDCRFYRNPDCNEAASYDDCPQIGGGGFLLNSGAEFTGCRFDENSASVSGAGVACISSEVAFVESVWEFNGGCSDACLPSVGGGLYCEGGSVSVESCEFRFNAGELAGGGLHGPATVSLSHFEANFGHQGGGVYGASLVECTLVANEAGGIVTGELGDGGGAAASTLTRCVVVGNRAASGGGLAYCVAVDTLITGNRAGDDFGGWGGGTSESDLTGCQVVGNLADGFIEDAVGGGVAFGCATATLIAGNSADGGGGAYAATLDRCTVVANVSSMTPGGALSSSLTSSVVWANSPDQLSPGTAVQYSDVQGGWPGTGNLHADPLFVDASHDNYHLAPGAPCIDTGDPAAPPDLDGSRVDMGAFEFVDCNGNGILDADDIGSGTSLDLNANGFPDECECLAYNYCETSPHSTGPGATMGVAGTTSVSQNDLVLVANACPPNKNGLFFYGPLQFQAPFGDGFRCVFGAVLRLTVVNSGPQGIAAYALNYDNPPQSSGQITPGSRWNFQFWFRDPPGPGGSGFNLTDGLEVVFCQ